MLQMVINNGAAAWCNSSIVFEKLLSEYYSANECYETYYTYDSQSCHFVFLLFPFCIY